MYKSLQKAVGGRSGLAELVWINPEVLQREGDIKLTYLANTYIALARQQHIVCVDMLWRIIP